MNLASRIFGWPGSFSSDSCFFPAQIAFNIYPQVSGTTSAIGNGLLRWIFV
jgi:hypothetical protein